MDVMSLKKLKLDHLDYITDHMEIKAASIERQSTTFKIQIFMDIQKNGISLKKSSNNEDLDGTVATGKHDHLLKVSNHNMSMAFCTVQMILFSLLMFTADINVLDFNKTLNFTSFDKEVEMLINMLINYPILFYIICNNLSVLITTQMSMLRNHPCLKIFKKNTNIVSYILEYKVLIDMQSFNHFLINEKIFDRSTRSRFNNWLISLLNCYINFTPQTLYFTKHEVLVSKFNQATFNKYTDVFKAKEECPIPDKLIISYHVDHNGGIFYNQDHDFALVVPPGAVSTGHCVEIQATASRFGPYKLPDGYYPISNFFWLSAYYTFKIPVYLIMGHYADIRNLKDIDNLFLLQACVRDLTISEGKQVLKKVLNNFQFEHETNCGIFTTDHFCSFCMAKKIMFLPENFLSFFYTYSTDKKYFAEICVCPGEPFECFKVFL